LYFVNGTYYNANDTWGVIKKYDNYMQYVAFLFNETGHNKTFALAPTYSELSINPQSTWQVNSNPLYYFTGLGFNSGNNPSPYTFGHVLLFSDSGNKSLTENYSVWLGFKDQWFDLYYPASITAINGSYEGRDNTTLTYNFSVDEQGLLRFNFSTNGIKHYLPVFQIKNAFNISAYSQHIWYRDITYNKNSDWIKLNNFTDFIIQEGNSSYFKYNYILLLINKTLGSDYEFWISNSSDPELIPPQYCCNSTNSTLAGKPALFSLKWQDNSGLSGYYFSTNNSGEWGRMIAL